MINEKLLLQYVRNTLQLNLGPRINSRDSIAEPVFAEIGYYAGVAETDWSWTPSVADFDNDGYRDIIITNGYPKDVTDHDFVAFRTELSNVASKQQLLDEIPQIKVASYAFKNSGNLKFEDVSRKWGIDEPEFSNGAVYADLDNDGDLDYVVNNINGEASLYENTIRGTEKNPANYLHVIFEGDKNNINGLGAWAEVYYDGQIQVYENIPYRGYLSTIDTKAYFGLGKKMSLIP